MSIHGQVLRSNVDMTQGRPLNVIFSFALPLLMGNLFNQLYNVVDTAIVGRALGADALAAVGSTGNINACLFLLLAGLATGVSVIVSQYWGAERYDELRHLSLNVEPAVLAEKYISLGIEVFDDSGVNLLLR